MAKGVRFNQNSYGAKADEDIVNARAVIPSHIGTPRGGIFWCEQAIEKYFKHIVSQGDGARGLESRHKLLPLAKEAGFSPSSEERFLLSELARMYYERYPADAGEEAPEEPDWRDAESALAFALRVQKWTYAVVDKRSAAAKSGLKNLQLY